MYTQIHNILNLVVNTYMCSDAELRYLTTQSGLTEGDSAALLWSDCCCCGGAGVGVAPVTSIGAEDVASLVAGRQSGNWKKRNCPFEP